MPHDNAALVALLREAANELHKRNSTFEMMAAPGAKLDGTAKQLATRLRAAADALAAGGEDASVAKALDGLSDLTLTQGHPEFGIECTAMIGDRYETVINQPSPTQAIINARQALDAARRAEEPRHD
jgi:hypothetical protein